MCLFLERERDLPPRGAVLGLPWTLCWRSWAAPGTYAAGLGVLLGLCCRSWAALGPYVEGLGPLLGPLLAVLGCLGPKSGQGPGGEAIWQAIRAEKSPEQLHIRSLLKPADRSPSQKFIIGFWGAKNPGQNPHQKSGQKPGQKSCQKSLKTCRIDYSSSRV